MDIIELALDWFRDFKRFEQLSTEILTLEGFTDIRPVGGIDDEGVDAEVTSYYKDESTRTIFQYTIQENLSSKISGTIKKLQTNGINFDELIFVTKNQINNIAALKTKARLDFNVRIDIYDRQTFIKQLSTEKGIFARYFPDIRKQLNSGLLDSKAVFNSNESKDPLEKSLLRSSLLFTFNSRAEGSRKSVFDETIFSILSISKDGLKREKIVEAFQTRFKKDLMFGELDASLKRLIRKNLIKVSGDDYVATPDAFEKLEGNLSRINSATNALVDDIISKVSDLYTEKISKHEESMIQQNIQNSLSAFFSLFGLECTDSTDFVGEYPVFSRNTDLIQIVQKGLKPRLGEALIYSIGEILKTPTDEQAEVLANWARAYVGVQLMGLDPKLRNMQATEISKKSFIIDTDFFLYALVENTTLCKIYRQILDELSALRCTIIIPEEVVLEAIKHAEFAERNFNYIRNAFDSVDDIIVEEKIANIYVKGYYNGLLAGTIEKSQFGFKDFLDNYFDKNSPVQFLKEVIKESFSCKFTFKEITSIGNCQIDAQELQKLTDAIFDQTSKTFKGKYRSVEENKEVAMTDAKLYLTLNAINSTSERNSDEIFGGTHYLLTSSTRSIRCAWQLGYKHNVISKPNTIVNLLDRLGKFHSTSKDIVNLFDNPFLIEAVNNSWVDIKALIDSGVHLRGKNIVRLKWDLDEEIKTYLADQERLDDSDDLNESEQMSSFIELVNNVKQKGYSLIPEVETLMNKYKALESEIEAKDVIHAELKEEIQKFGKRRQNYFDKVEKAKGK